MDHNNTNSALEGRRFAATVNGSIGVVAAEAQIGDVVICGHRPFTTPIVPMMLVRTADELRTPEIDSQLRGESMTIPGEAVSGDSIHHCISVGECYFTDLGLREAVHDDRSLIDGKSEMFVIH